MYKKRILEISIQKASKTFPVVMVTGPRQVGKTTVLKNCAPKRKYVTLDTMADRVLAKEDPALFLQKHAPPVLIDEIQYAPELFSAIKVRVDQDRTMGMYWLTGSQQFPLMKNVSESLAGRIALLRLQGFSQQERLGCFYDNIFLHTDTALHQKHPAIALMKLYEMIWRGSYPALVCTEEMDWEMFYDAYLQTYIERDIRDLGIVSQEHVFLKFMRALAARTGQLLNYSEIARDIGVSGPTIKSWLSVLQTSGIVYLLEPYYANLTSRMTKMPKIYFLDTGLACFLANWSNYKALESSAMSRTILETYIVSEILKSFWFLGKRAPLFFYRDKDQREIDIVIENNGELLPIDIKKKTVPDRHDVKNFPIVNDKKGFVICLATDDSPITKNILAIPVGYV